MKRLLFPLLLLLSFTAVAQAQYVKILSVAEQGGNAVITSGVTSTTKVAKTFPGATVTIFSPSGSGVTATIFSTSAGVSKANPFTASSTDATIDFFIAPGATFDIRISGTSGGVSITPFTRSGYTAPGTSGISLALCGGTADTSLLAALSALGGTIEIPRGTTCASNSQTLSAAMQIDNGGLLKPITGQTVALTGAQAPGTWQRFTNATAGLGTVTLTNEAYPDWWAVNTTPGTTDMAAAMQAAASSGAKRIRFLPTTYKNTTVTEITGSGVSIAGESGTTIYSVRVAAKDSGNLKITYAFSIAGTSAQTGVEFRDLQFTGSGQWGGIYSSILYVLDPEGWASVGPPPAVDTLAWTTTRYGCKIENVGFTGTYYESIDLTNVSVDIRGVRITNGVNTDNNGNLVVRYGQGITISDVVFRNCQYKNLNTGWNDGLTIKGVQVLNAYDSGTFGGHDGVGVYVGHFSRNVTVDGYVFDSPKRSVTDVATNSTTTITSATAQFTSNDIGKVIVLSGGGSLTTTIASVANLTTAVLTAAASWTSAGNTSVIGTNFEQFMKISYNSTNVAISNCAMNGTGYIMLQAVQGLTMSNSVVQTSGYMALQLIGYAGSAPAPPDLYPTNVKISGNTFISTEDGTVEPKVIDLSNASGLVFDNNRVVGNVYANAAIIPNSQVLSAFTIGPRITNNDIFFSTSWAGTSVAAVMLRDFNNGTGLCQFNGNHVYTAEDYSTVIFSGDVSGSATGANIEFMDNSISCNATASYPVFITQASTGRFISSGNIGFGAQTFSLIFANYTNNSNVYVTDDGAFQEFTATADFGGAVCYRKVFLTNAATPIVTTLRAPKQGDIIWIVDNSPSGTAAHTVTVPAGVTWDGTNRVATFNARGELLFAIALSTTRWLVITNSGVTFS